MFRCTHPAFLNEDTCPLCDGETAQHPRARVMQEVWKERDRQEVKWGEQNHPDGTGGPVLRMKADEAQVMCDEAAKQHVMRWRYILEEEVAEAMAESDPALLRAELVQVAAVAVSWIEALDRRKRSST